MISKNGVALAVFVLGFLGINVTETALLEVVSAVLTIVSFGLMVLNQWNREDVKGFFFKK